MTPAPVASERRHGSVAFLLPVFFFSGFTSLVYQVVWQKALSQLIGVDHISVTLIVALFMLGLGLGGIMAVPIVRSGVNLVRTYVAVEVALALYGFFSLALLRRANLSFQEVGSGYLQDFTVNLAVLIVPTVLMGMSLPVVLHLFRRHFSVGQAIAVVYSVNIAGAATGALATGFLLIGTVGMTRSCQIAAAINLILGIAVGTRFKDAQPDSAAPAEAVVAAKADGGTLFGWPLFLMSFLSGFAALSYEIAFFRLITAYFGSTAYAFSILIFSYLVMMSAGNYVFGKQSDRLPPATLYLYAACGAVISTLTVLWGQELMHLVGFRQNYLVMWPFRTWLAFAQIPLVLAVSLLLMLPVAFTSGFFPVILKHATPDSSQLGSRAGLIYFTQTLGNFTGSLLTGFWLLPVLGTVGTLRALAGLLAVVALIPVLRNLPMAFAGRQRALLTGAAVLALLTYPANFYSTVRLYYEADKTDVRQPAVIKEGAFGTTLGYEKANRQMEVYVSRMFSNSFPMKGVQFNTIQDCFPMDWIAGIEGLEVRKALYIGMGSGVGTYCIQKMFPGVQLDIVEINPELVTMIRESGAEIIVDALNRSEVFVSDGRRFVQQHPESRYDLIQVGVFSAWCSGCGNVFTEEFFRILSTRLTPNGGVTFNAYPAAIASGLNAFGHLTVLSPGPSRISDTWATNTTQAPVFSPGKFQAMAQRIEAELTPGSVRIKRLNITEGCLADGNDLRQWVDGITPATDDKPATEYFLTNNQFTYPVDWRQLRPERDMRIFGCEGRPAHPLKAAIDGT